MASSPAARPAPLSGLHLLLTYECNFECDHCFVWGGPDQAGTMSAATVERILQEADRLGTIEWIYFEGGEPFLHYELLCSGVERARQKGFRVGIVTNAFWASSEEEATSRLRPLAGLVDDLSISEDLYHGSDEDPPTTRLARRAAGELGSGTVKRVADGFLRRRVACVRANARGRIRRCLPGARGREARCAGAAQALAHIRRVPLGRSAPS